MSQLEAIWIKHAHHEPMHAVQTAQIVAGEGIKGNAEYGARRQVTIIEREVFDGLPESIRTSVKPSDRRANLMVSGVPLVETKGRVLQVGACKIRILGETTPCSRMDEACPGLMEALVPNWGGGAWGEVLSDGEIAVGDPVSWVG